jgi:hypothetical protein
VKAAEENAGGTAVLFIRHVQRRAIETKIGPMIVPRKLPEILDGHRIVPLQQARMIA